MAESEFEPRSIESQSPLNCIIYGLSFWSWAARTQSVGAGSGAHKVCLWVSSPLLQDSESQRVVPPSLRTWLRFKFSDTAALQWSPAIRCNHFPGGSNACLSERATTLGWHSHLGLLYHGTLQGQRDCTSLSQARWEHCTVRLVCFFSAILFYMGGQSWLKSGWGLKTL